MSNSYATVPAIIPGNLRVQGNLTVSGSQFILGQLAKKYRLQEMGLGNFVETVNLDRIAVKQDDATQTSQTRTIQPSANPFSLATEAAGIPGTDQPLLVLTPTAFQALVAELRLGPVIPYVRLIQTGQGVGYWSVNLQSDGLTHDDATKSAFFLRYDCPNMMLASAIRTAGNNLIDMRPPQVFWYDNTFRHYTGVVGPQTVSTRSIYAGVLGTYGALILRITGMVTVSATGTIQLNGVWGGNTQLIQSFPANTNAYFWAHLLLTAEQTTGNQWLQAWGVIGGVTSTQNTTSVNVDTTITQQLAVQVNASDTSSIVNIYTIQGELICLQALL